MASPIHSNRQSLHMALLAGSQSTSFSLKPGTPCNEEAFKELTDLMRDFSQRGSPITPMQAATMKGNYRVCKQLLMEHADLRTYSSVPPALSIALDLDRFQIARLMIDNGADLLLLHEGFYPMFYALKPHTPEYIVEAFVDSSYPIDSVIQKDYGYTALHKAVICKNVDVVKALIRLKANCNVRDTRTRSTPLHYAVKAKSPLIAHILIDNGADIEAEDCNGSSPLFKTIEINDIFILNFLLELGADVHHLNSIKLIYPLNLAANLGNLAVVKALIKHGADPCRVAPGTADLPIHSAVLSNIKTTPENTERLKSITEFLIERGSEINVPNKSGYTPVQLALMMQRFAIVEALIKGGATVNFRLDQDTGFHYVAKEAAKDLVSLFLDYGADYSVIGTNSNTPYHLAMFNRDPNVLSDFWKFGCPFDLPRNGLICNSCSPEVLKKLDDQKKLMLGIKNNKVKMIRSALSNGAEVRGCSMEIPYPLHFAVSSGFSSVVLVLLENGVPSNIINDDGESPLHIAASKGYSQICQYLLRYGACYNALTTPSGKTPMGLALENGHFEIVYILREIDLMFKSSVNNSFEGLQGMFEKSKNVQSLQAYINSIDRAGNTLMGVALKAKNTDLVENLVKLRLQIIKA